MVESSEFSRTFKEIRSYKRYMLLLVFILAGLIGLFTVQSGSPIPSSVTKSANFKIYYPKDLPKGYSYDKKSASYQQGILFFSVVSGGKKIIFSEQAKPSPPPDLIALTKPQKAQLPPGLSGVAPPTLSPSFKEIDCSVGQAIIGTNINNTPTAIVLTDKTLINISSTSTLTDTAIREIVASLK